MGTINYGTSDYITIGYNCDLIDYDNYEDCADVVQWCYDKISDRLEQERFYYFDIKVKPGYYEGFYIDIEYNYSYCLDNYTDKRWAQMEITSIKKFLLDCVNYFDCCVVYPGWCTRYLDNVTTLKEINGAIKDMRDTVKSTPTWARLPKSEKWA